MNKTRTFLENLVILAIVLVLVQTFLEDLATLLSWSVSVREALLIAGFFFDLFFTVEFIVRGYDAWRYRRFGYYFWYDRGWIDFLASVPLLLLNSGPGLLRAPCGGRVGCRRRKHAERPQSGQGDSDRPGVAPPARSQGIPAHKEHRFRHGAAAPFHDQCDIGVGICVCAASPVGCVFRGDGSLPANGVPAARDGGVRLYPE